MPGLSKCSNFMAERSSSLACKKFSANVFDKNKCQNCFKPKDAHNTSPTMPERPTNLEVKSDFVVKIFDISQFM